MAKGASSSGRREDGSKATVSLPQVASFAGWSTPQQRDYKGEPGTAATESGSFGASLPRYVTMAGWPTPTSALADKGVRTEEGALREAMRTSGADLAAIVSTAGWPTPNAGPQNDNDSTWEMRRELLKEKHGNGNGFGMTMGQAVTLCGPARLTASGELLTGSDAAMESGGQLDPAHSLWLQLGPWSIAWGNCAARVMRSTSRKRKASCAP